MKQKRNDCMQGTKQQRAPHVFLILAALCLVVWGVRARGRGVAEIAAVFLVRGILCGAAAGFGANRICVCLKTAVKR